MWKLTITITVFLSLMLACASVMSSDEENIGQGEDLMVMDQMTDLQLALKDALADMEVSRTGGINVITIGGEVDESQINMFSCTSADRQRIVEPLLPVEPPTHP